MSVAHPIPTEFVPALLAAAAAEGPSTHALCLAGLSWGFRVSELLALRVGHVCDDAGKAKGSVTLERRALKFGKNATLGRKLRSRSVPISAELQRVLTEFLFSRFGAGPYPADQPLFAGRFPGEAMHRKSVERTVQRLAVAIGLPADRTWSSHTFRKTFAKHVYAVSGFDIVKTQRALGHSSIITTQRYLPCDAEEVTAAIASAQGMFAAAATRPDSSGGVRGNAHGLKVAGGAGGPVARSWVS